MTFNDAQNALDKLLELDEQHDSAACFRRACWGLGLCNAPLSAAYLAIMHKLESALYNVKSVKESGGEAPGKLESALESVNRYLDLIQQRLIELYHNEQDEHDKAAFIADCYDD